MEVLAELEREADKIASDRANEVYSWLVAEAMEDVIDWQWRGSSCNGVILYRHRCSWYKAWLKHDRSQSSSRSVLWRLINLSPCGQCVGCANTTPNVSAVKSEAKLEISGARECRYWWDTRCYLLNS